MLEITYQEKEISEVAEKLKEYLRPRDIVTFSGELAYGKTTLIKALVRRLGYDGVVNSPTFVIERRYPLTDSDIETIIHLDFYRLDPSAIERLDWSEYLDNPRAIVLIEWPEKITREMPERTKKIIISYQDEKTRTIILSENFNN